MKKHSLLSYGDEITIIAKVICDLVYQVDFGVKKATFIVQHSHNKETRLYHVTAYGKNASDCFRNIEIGNLIHLQGIWEPNITECLEAVMVKTIRILHSNSMLQKQTDIAN